MRLREALDRFVMQLRADGRSELTIGNYRRHIGELDAWLAAGRRSDELGSIMPETLAAFLIAPPTRASAHGRNRSTLSMNAVRTSLRVFFAWTHDAGCASTNSARLIRRAICSPPPPKALSNAEVDRLIAALITARGCVARRDHLLIDVLLSTGIRIGSALALDVDDIDLEAGTLTLRRCKYDRVERVFFGRDLRDHLIGYLTHKPRTGPLFRGPRGERLGKRSAQARIALWLERAGVDGTVHGLRHTFATRLYAKTADVLLVQAALRHRSLLSTLVYAQCDSKMLRAALGCTSPAVT